MNSQQLLYILISIALIFVIFYVIFRPQPKQPTLLNLRAADSESYLKKNDTNAVDKPTEEAVVDQNALEKNAPQVKPPTKPPQIYFVYNGHEWNAYEVLGLTATDGLEEATKIYQDLIKTSDSSTFEFYEAAYNAILKKRKES